MPPTLRSHLAGQWFGATADLPLAHAVTGEIVAFTHREQPDFGAALAYARGDGLRAMDFDGPLVEEFLREYSRQIRLHRNFVHNIDWLVRIGWLRHESHGARPLALFAARDRRRA
jgi:hypothetical protein